MMKRKRVDDSRGPAAAATSKDTGVAHGALGADDGSLPENKPGWVVYNDDTIQVQILLGHGKFAVDAELGAIFTPV